MNIILQNYKNLIENIIKDTILRIGCDFLSLFTS